MSTYGPYTSWDADNTWNNQTVRYIIPAASIGASGAMLRLTLGYRSANWAFDKVYIGHKAAAGDAYDFAAAPTQVLFGGLAGGTVTAGGLQSDATTFALDETKDLIVAIFHSTSQNVPRDDGSAGYALYYKAGDDAATQDATGYSTSVYSGQAHYVQQIDVNIVDDSYTKVLHHFNGVDASTTFTDDAGKSWTAANNAQLDTAQKVFGTASLLLDGTGDLIYTTDHSDFDPADADFSIDFRVRFAALPSSTHAMICQHYQGDSDNWYVSLFHDGSSYYWKLKSQTTGGGTALDIVEETTVLVDTWYHVAICRSGDVFYWFQDGIKLGTEDTDVSNVDSLTGNFSIGGGYSSSNPAYGVNGWIDEFRYSVGVARWTANFTPPAVEYSPNVTTSPPVTAFTWTGYGPYGSIANIPVTALAWTANVPDQKVSIPIPAAAFTWTANVPGMKVTQPVPVAAFVWMAHQIAMSGQRPNRYRFPVKTFGRHLSIKLQNDQLTEGFILVDCMANIAATRPNTPTPVQAKGSHISLKLAGKASDSFSLDRLSLNMVAQKER